MLMFPVTCDCALGGSLGPGEPSVVFVSLSSRGAVTCGLHRPTAHFRVGLGRSEAGVQCVQGQRAHGPLASRAGSTASSPAFFCHSSSLGGFLSVCNWHPWTSSRGDRVRSGLEWSAMLGQGLIAGTAQCWPVAVMSVSRSVGGDTGLLGL